MAVKHKGRKMKVNDDDSKESGLKLHKTNCDTLYRWSMWRMYLNEELSRVISARRDHLDYSNSVFSVTSPYIRHPDGKVYGHQMKKLFKRNMKHSHSGDILSDNVYLVYGLPRVSIKNRAPEEVQKLHESVHELEMLHKQRDRQSDDSAGADEQISKLFDFVTSDDTVNDNYESVRLLGETEKYQGISNSGADFSTTGVQSASSGHIKDDLLAKLDSSSNGNTKDGDKVDINMTTKSQKHIPPVSKSRLFWERLAHKKSEIIDMGKDKPDIKDNHEHTMISDEILQKQQKLLKKPTPKRTSRDLWRTLRERKTEILQLREITEGQKNEHGNQIKRRESKTSQLWGFIFHKKKELVPLKRGNKVPIEVTKSHNGYGQKGFALESNDSKPNISPRNFEDSFQKELAARLKKRRDHLEPTLENTE
ncbi:uncharacterized protein LOC123524574 [Mercenaria mercenaria]|uniref:uncharacterized protein LOC123524574 n=1 Tax=Mercenaria mercenaria TaxID=6596 RepID=UPI00234F522C|nr:uncharacterized protein LOC123524574 [Mercenaria mercenaria]XP_045158800.2 uncharacterized protein LOC123524574 [Mercenaria mercenaria]XP_045158802.2 uncharacterized protein LOC123524574 [Mercenaria mercenaria]